MNEWDKVRDKESINQGQKTTQKEREIINKWKDRQIEKAKWMKDRKIENVVESCLYEKLIWKARDRPRDKDNDDDAMTMMMMKMKMMNK